MALTSVQKTANTPPRLRKSATAIMTHSPESAKIQTPTQVRHTKGPLPNVTGQEGPHMSTPPTEEAHSAGSSSVQLDLDDQLTATHPTRNEDTMDPELQILPAIVFLLLYQEHVCRRRRQREYCTYDTGKGGGKKQ
ncbi:hypothetical protein NDU88_003368 [Pleurodeles waltl]|uniref:Uncharacterized protein n=1 Tax=Pleurodeles waltl TaxID=8319 RepID=A0AAV7VD51_PLEWA|nr:hypothetical protein NDU88_003368 [Pleurodeles waltl]